MAGGHPFTGAGRVRVSNAVGRRFDMCRKYDKTTGERDETERKRRKNDSSKREKKKSVAEGFKNLKGAQPTAPTRYGKYDEKHSERSLFWGK